MRQLGGAASAMLAIGVTAGLAAQEAPGPERAWALGNVQVVDVRTGVIRTGQTVVIRDGRIASVVTGNHPALPRGVRVVDGQGRYVIPGLWDMHTHLSTFSIVPREGNAGAFAAAEKWAVPLLVANGVTGIRDMSGDLATLVRIRESIKRGDLVGPRMVVTGGKLGEGGGVVPGAPVTFRTAADVRDALQALKRGGADFAKLSGLPPELYPSLATESAALRLPFAGHVPGDADVGDLSDLGIRSVEHLQGVMMASSIRHHELLARIRNGPTWTERIRGWGASVLGRAHPHAELKAPRQILVEALETYDDSTAADLFRRFVRNGTWQTPTLVQLRDMYGVGILDQKRDGQAEYAPRTLVDWEAHGGDVRDVRLVARAIRLEGKLVRSMSKAGVGILAGSDMPGTQRLPGFSLHDELEMLGQAGLSPLEVLRTATLNPAEYLGGQDTLGAVAAGYAADLVLLGKNPLEHVENLRDIQAVVIQGRLVDRAGLDRMLETVREVVRQWPARRPAAAATSRRPQTESSLQ